MTYLRTLTAIDDTLDDERESTISKYFKTLGYNELKPYFINKTWNDPEHQETSKSEPWKSYAAAKLDSKDTLKLQRFCSSFAMLKLEIHREALKLAFKATDAEPFLQSVHNLLHVVHLELTKEWQTLKDHNLFSPIQHQLRNISSGALVVSEAAALQMGVKVSQDIRDHFLFKMLHAENASYLSKVNDMLSYANETESGKEAITNEVYILNAIKHFPLSNAFQMANDEANESIKRLTTCGEMLEDFFPEDEQLKVYIKTVKNLVCGIVQSSCFLGRYNIMSNVDCYLHVSFDPE